MKKWAAYVAGNEKIFFPALVSLISLQEHSPGQFDCFIAFNGEHKSDKMDALLAQYGIIFIDTSNLKFSEMAMQLPSMGNGRWPAEIHINWLLPEHFHNLGYAYSLTHILQVSR